MILAKAVLIEVILIFRDVATNFAARARLRALGASLGRAMLIKIDPGSQVTLGQRVRFGHGTIVSVQRDEFTDGVSSLDTLVVGDDTTFMEFCNIRAGGGGINIGCGCLFGQYVSVISTNHNLRNRLPFLKAGAASARRGVVIGDDVWVGAGAVILPGVRLGSGCVVAANAVVNANVPAFAIVGGVPARIIGLRNSRS